MSGTGLSLGLGLLSIAQGYQNKQAAMKQEAERLADKQREQQRQQIADQRAAESHKMQMQSSQYGLDQQKQNDQYQQAERNRLSTLRDGLGRAAMAHQSGDQAGFFDALESTGNGISSAVQMKFQRDGQGRVIVDKNGNAIGQRFTKDGQPLGSPSPVNYQKAYVGLSALVDPQKFLESEQAAQKELEKYQREQEGRKDLARFENSLNLGAYAKKSDMDEQRSNREATRDQQYKRENTLFEHSLKAPESTKGSSKDPYAGQSALGSGLDFSSISTEAVMPFLIGTESGGQHVDASGQLTTSPKGAKGITQVMPKTGASPGYGVRPLQNQSQQEYERFGREYLQAMRNQFKGHPEELALGLASYNAGPDTVKKAVAAQAQRGGHWIDYLPAETKAYIPSILNKVAAQQQSASVLLGRNTQAANIIASKVPDLSKQIVTDLKDTDSPVDGAMATAVLQRSSDLLVRMHRAKPDQKRELFTKAAEQIATILPASMSQQQQVDYIHVVMANLLGEPSPQSMFNNLRFGQDQKPKAAKPSSKTTEVDSPLIAPQQSVKTSSAPVALPLGHQAPMTLALPSDKSKVDPQVFANFGL